MTAELHALAHPLKVSNSLIYKEKRDLSTEQASPYLLLLCINLSKRRIQRQSQFKN